jgi:aspartate aminotransferase-like enzyme
LLAFTKREKVENESVSRNGLRILPGAGNLSGSGVRIQQMGDVDLRRILELHSVVR